MDSNEIDQNKTNLVLFKNKLERLYWLITIITM